MEKKMPLRRKHQLIIEATFSQAITEKEAVRALGLLMDRLDLQAEPIWARHPDIYCDKLTFKELTRVLPSLIAKRLGGWP
jgi:hypothetical protein